MKTNDICQESLRSAAEKYVKRRYYKHAWGTEIRTFIAGAKWASLKLADQFKPNSTATKENNNG